MDAWIIKETCLDHCYEANGVSIKNGWTIVDIGAGVGDFAIYVANEHPTTQIYAYEPFPESFALLKENIRLNAIKGIRAFPIAVGPQSGTMALFTTGEAIQHITTEHTTMSKANSKLEVPALSLNDVFQINAIRHCDLLKIDCEGSEFEILFKASRATLKKIQCICLEYHDGFTRFSHVDLATYLQQHGFQVKVTPNPVHRYLGFLTAHQ
jgi:FkbM family methyltransferase